MAARSAISHRRARFVTSPLFCAAGFGSHHPLSIPRHRALLGLLKALGWLSPDETVECPLPDVDVLARYHARAYVEVFRHAAETLKASREVRERYNLGSMECPLFEGVWDRARATVGGAIAAAELALTGTPAFHPGGGTHHGRKDRASGFCYFNDPVFAILTLLDAGLRRVLYVDLDAHHGDGVEDAFASDGRVMTISIHEQGKWPGTGRLHDRREGRARNMPVPRGLNDSELAVLMTDAVLPIGRAFEPDAVVVVCGTDSLAGDPLSGLALSNSALCDAVMSAIGLAPRAVVLGGGGYNPWTLARAWAGLWGLVSGRDVTVPLTTEAKAVLASLDCDLVDAEDREAEWFTTLWDAPREGPVRDEIRRIADASRA